MPPRHLFGPVAPEVADQRLSTLKDQTCRTFALRGRADMLLSWHDSWDRAFARLPSGWRPEFVAVSTARTALPPWLFTCPVPLIALATHSAESWTAHRQLLPLFDLVLADAPSADALHRTGMGHVRAAPLFGLDRDFLVPVPEIPRDIDVLFLGSLDPIWRAERLPWLARVAALADRYRVHIDSAVTGAEYRHLLRRAKIVFNRSAHAGCNRRTFEAPACGALLVQEFENRDVPQWLAPGREYVTYADDNLEPLIEYYLTHESDRAAIAEAGRRRVQGYSFDAVWTNLADEIGRELPGLRDRAASRLSAGEGHGLLTRVALNHTTVSGRDVTLERELGDAVREAPDDAHVAYLYGVAGNGGTAAFERSLELDADHHLARLALARELLAAGRAPSAAQFAADGIERLERDGWADSLAGLPPPNSHDRFRHEWERAGFTFAGEAAAERAAKRSLLRLELLLTLGESARDPGALYEARLEAPGSPAAAASLGRALAGAGRYTAAGRHLRYALEQLPFDVTLASDLADSHRIRGDAPALDRLIGERRRLAAAGPVAWDDWFVPPPPAADSCLVSILVLCCNEVKLTHSCLTSVLRHTRTPYELILVDNGSTDATPEFLREVASSTGPARVAVVRNDRNLGYAGGVNRGLAEAKGDWVCLLNNDTEVYSGWLDGLLAAAAAGGPRVGIVGPISNYAAPPQLVDNVPDDRAGRAAFAEQARLCASPFTEVPRLTGFCQLVRSEVWRQLGGLDERFGPGFFEDDDLCLRARRAGWRLMLTRGVFIHHEGSRTFHGLGLDASEMLRKNFAKFRDKWGEAAVAGYADPFAQPIPIRRRGRRVSLTMIVRNEEANIRDCLLCVRDLVDEIIVIDTGSTDRTREIARELGAKVYEFPWIDDFAAARNEALRHATGDWAFWLDADDRLDEENRARLRQLFASLPETPAAYVIKCECIRSAPGDAATVVDHVRLFPLDDRVRWRHRIHEQILPSLRSVGAEVHWSDVVVQHIGYVDPALRGRKLDRDLRILMLELQELPDHPFTQFNLGQAYLERSDPLTALRHFRASLTRSAPGDSITRKLFSMLAHCLRHLDRSPEAVPVLAEGRRHFPEDAELIYGEAQLRLEGGDAAGAERLARELLAGKEKAHFASVDASLRGAKARHLLAAALLFQDRRADAEHEWQGLLASDADYRPAWLGLGELYLRESRWAEVAVAVGRLGPGSPEGAALREKAARAGAAL